MKPENGRRKRILFVTGTRADFGKMKPLILAVDSDPGFDCTVFATGMHLLPRYGLTVNEIRHSGINDIVSHVNQDDSGDPRMDLILAATLQGLSACVHSMKADMIVVHGDRVEALAGALAGVLNNVRTAHVEGGELSGTVDEVLRHAVTKLAHVHFAANEDARRRLLQLGEAEEAIHVIGSPDIDVLLGPALPPLEEVKRRYEIPFEEYGILIYHPVSYEVESLPAKLDALMAGVRESGLPFVAIYPNNETGSHAILAAYEAASRTTPLKMIPSMRFEYFASLLKSARCIVGNSSAGIREAPVFGVPCVNVGSRQRNRFRHEAIWDVGESAAEITACILGVPRAAPRSLHFGRGDAARRFMGCLREPGFWEMAMEKQLREIRVSA
jgi:UDP-N-acetylglucosamine 2-epimerase (hydrolysing)